MIAEGPFTCRVFCALEFITSNVDVRQRSHNRRFFMKYMHAIGQHGRLSLVNGLLLMQMFSQAPADKLRTVSQGMPGAQKKQQLQTGELQVSDSSKIALIPTRSTSKLSSAMRMFSVA